MRCGSSKQDVWASADSPSVMLSCARPWMWNLALALIPLPSDFHRRYCKLLCCAVYQFVRAVNLHLVFERNLSGLHAMKIASL